MVRKRRPSPEEIAGGLDRQARTIGIVAMIIGVATIAACAWLLFTAEEVAIEMLFCFATLGLLALLAGYQKLRAGHHHGDEWS